MQEIREQVKHSIKQRCGTMRVLDMTQPIELTGERGIYTNVNILEKITGRRRLEIAELLQNCDVEDFERFGLSQVAEKRVPGLEAVKQYSKLMVLGKPGAGKTTFLKYLAMQCIEGLFQANRVPLFITLKDFAEASGQPELLTYLSLWDRHFARPPKGADKMSTPQDVSMLKILQEGRALVLLDGLDEVREEDTKRVLRQILEISDHFHTNQFVITCRIAAKEYTFERFAEVEVADFDEEQIAIFAQNWFRLSDRVKGERFIQKLKENKPIQELATNPLLLTLLCLVFGEAGNFPTNRSELYKEGLDVLLKKWDAKRNIERDQVYKNLSLQRKEDLLSQIALTTFEQKDYFFKQKTVEAYIADFIRNLRDADSNPEVLRLDSEAVLKSIEAQHGLLVERAKGIYSFSHLTFQEYFAAREIVANSAWENLIEHMTEPRWREVFLLTAGMMRKADELVGLMKRNIDGLVVNNDKIQGFLDWVNQKALAITIYRQALVRDFYCNYLCKLKKNQYSIIECSQALKLQKIETLLEKLLQTKIAAKELLKEVQNTTLLIDSGIVVSQNSVVDDFLITDCNLTKDKYRTSEKLTNKLTHSIERALDIGRAFNIPQAYSFPPKFDLAPYASNLGAYHLEFNPSLRIALQRLVYQLPYESGLQAWHIWWKSQGSTWIEQLKAVMVEHCWIAHKWFFTHEEQALLAQYYNANKLLVDCLNSDCYVSREVRQEIEDTLLLPMAEIEKRHR